MYQLWFKWWSDLFQNSFNYSYDYVFQMFNPQMRIGTDDDIVVMGDVTIVLPHNKKRDNARQVKEAVLEAVHTKYRQDKTRFHRRVS